jgi:hypothetical protein
MLKSKTIRTRLILLGVVFIVALFFLPINYPTPTDAALITPPPRSTRTPRPDNDNSGKKNSDNTTLAAIYGRVTDLSTGQPGQGLEIKINGSSVRTDSDGRYSLTGLGAGNYTAVLQLPGGATTAPQSSAVVYVAEKQTITLDLAYYSQTPPTSTPTNVPVPTPPPPPPVEAVIEDEAAPTAGDVSSALSPLLPSEGGSPAVWINPGHINNEEGVDGNIAIDVANVSDLGAFQATLKFDPKIIEIEDVVLGNFLDSTGRQTKPLVTDIDNTSGEISFVAFTSGDTAGPNGGGTLAVVSFTSKQAGVSELELNDALLVGRLGKKIAADVGSGQISVTTCFGDLNKDKVIDVGDVQAAAGRANQTVGDPNYVPEFDLNNYRIIDETDVTAITARLDESCH